MANFSIKIVITIILYVFLQSPSIAQFNTIRHQIIPNKKMDSICLNQDSLLKIKSLDSLSWRMVYAQFCSDKTDTVKNKTVGKYYAPLHFLQYTSLFGLRFHPLDKQLKLHKGVDLKARYEPVYSIADGAVKVVGYGKNEGNFIVISHDGLESIYCHLSVIICKQGQYLKGGSCIAISGNTGSSTKPHLHFGLKLYGVAINPIVYLKNISLLND